MRDWLDQLHARARDWPPFQRLAIVTRILLAIAFLPTGTVKLLGHRFTSLPVDTPVGGYFEAMYQTGFYWNFIGASQVIAALLLLIPRTTTLGAVAFFPIILNVTIVTWSVGFQGTIYLTALMLLASVFLLCWDYDRLRDIVFEPSQRTRLASPKIEGVERLGYLIAGAAGMVMFLPLRGLAPRSVTFVSLGVGAIGGLLVLAGWVKLALARRPSLS